MPSTKRVRNPVKCHICKENLGKRRELMAKARVKKTVRSEDNHEYTDRVDFRTIPEMPMSEEDERLQSYRDLKTPRTSEENHRESSNEMRTQTLNEKTVVPPLEEFIHVPNLTNPIDSSLDQSTPVLFDPYLSEHLASLGYSIESDLNTTYTNENRSEMRIKYHGMGHSQVIGINPRRYHDGEERCYFGGILGGNNGYEGEDNDRAFRRIGQLGTHYYNVREIITLVSLSLGREEYLFDCAPKEQRSN